MYCLKTLIFFSRVPLITQIGVSCYDLLSLLPLEVAREAGLRKLVFKKLVIVVIFFGEIIYYFIFLLYVKFVYYKD
jgi:hypothetical protein